VGSEFSPSSSLRSFYFLVNSTNIYLHAHTPSDPHIPTINTPNLGLGIAVSVREREQGRFRGSTEGVWGSIEGVLGSTGAKREQARGKEEQGGREGRGLFWLLVLGVAQHRGAGIGCLVTGYCCSQYL